MVAEGHGLSRLQMRKTGHDGLGVFFRLVHQSGLQIRQLSVQFVDGVAHPELEIHGDLIVARTRRVQAAGDGADLFRKARFHIHVNVFQRAGKGEISRLDFGSDLV